MLMMSFDDDEDDVDENYNDENEDDENDENDEFDLEMFLIDLKEFYGGTTCKDVENLFLWTEGLNATDFSIYTFFCGCEGVQSVSFSMPFIQLNSSVVLDIFSLILISVACFVYYFL